MTFIQNLINGHILYQLGCDVWNAFVDISLAFLVKTPEEIDSNLWTVVMDNIYPLFLAVGSALVVTFFFLGLYRDVSDYRQIVQLESLIFILIRLGICQAVIVGLKPFIMAMFQSGQALSRMIINRMGFVTGSAYGHLQPSSEYLKSGSLMFAGTIIGILFFIAALTCGASICLSVFQRIVKIIFAAPTGALAIATIAGGRELSRTASSWFQEFLVVILEASFMILAIGVCVPIMAIPLFPGSGVVDTLMSIIEPAFKMVLMSSAVRGSGAIFRKFLGMH